MGSNCIGLWSKKTLLVAFSVSLFCGCRSPVQLVEPSQFAQIIQNRPANVRVEPVAYMMSATRKGLKLRIFNLTDRTITLLPDASYVVDPWHQRAPLRAERIPSHNSVTVQFPPKSDTAVWEPVQPSPGRTFERPVPVFYPEMRDTQWPPYAVDTRQTSVRSEYMWEWPKGRIRVHLEFESAGHHYSQEFVFDRP